MDSTTKVPPQQAHTVAMGSSSLDRALGELSGKISGMDGRLSSIEGTVNRVEDKLAVVAEAQAALGGNCKATREAIWCEIKDLKNDQDSLRQSDKIAIDSKRKTWMWAIGILVSLFIAAGGWITAVAIK